MHHGVSSVNSYSLSKFCHSQPLSKFYQNQSPVKVLLHSGAPVKVLSQPNPSPSSIKINLPSKFCCILVHLSKFCPNVEVLSDKLKCSKILHLQPHLNPNVDHLQKFSWEISETFTHKLIRKCRKCNVQRCHILITVQPYKTRQKSRILNPMVVHFFASPPPQGENEH